MTREEASNILDDYDVNFDGHTAEEIAKAFDVAFKALEQDPCEDAISRQAAIDAVIDLCKHYTPTKSVDYPHIDFVIEALQDLPPVNPQQKTGHWIYKQYDSYPECGNWHCSECDEIDNRTSAYCPKCGAKMEVKDAD